MKFFCAALVASSWLPLQAWADLPSEFDFVVVGGGASGLPCAIELARKFPASPIAVIERGTDPERDPAFNRFTKPGAPGEPRILKASSWPSIARDDLGSDAVEKVVYNDKPAITLVGRVLGGGSAVNAGVQILAPDKFMEEMFDFNADRLKTYHDVADSIMFNGRVARPSPAYDDATLSFADASIALGYPYYPSDKPLDAQPPQMTPPGYDANASYVWRSYTNFNYELDERFTFAAELRWQQKHNGVGNNVHILTRTTVTKINFDEGQQPPRAVGVSTTGDHAGEIKLTPQGAVVMAAGAIHTPRVLMASGIGPKNKLSAATIPLLVRNEAIGQTFRDRNLVNKIQFNRNAKTTRMLSITNLVTDFPKNSFHERTMAGDIAVSFAFATLQGSNPWTRKYEWSRESERKLLASSMKLGNVENCTNNGFEVFTLQMRQDMYGDILASKDVTEDAKVNQGQMSERDEDWYNDNKQTVNGYLGTKALQAWRRPNWCLENCIGLEVGHDCNLTPKPWKYTLNSFPWSQSSKAPGSSFHLTGGAVYKKATDDHFRVQGVDRVYVVDASLFPQLPDHNPQTTVSVLGGTIAKEFIELAAAPTRDDL